MASHSRNTSNEPVIAPGASSLIRDAAWQVRQFDRASTGDLLIEVAGLSKLNGIDVLAARELGMTLKKLKTI